MSTQLIFQSKWPKSIEPDPYSYTEGLDDICRFASKVSGRNFIHNVLAHAINPATTMVSAENQIQIDQNRVALLDENGAYKAELVKLESADGAKVEGAFFPGTSKEAILFALDAGSCYEDVANSEDAAHAFVQFFREKIGGGINVFVINTRGICHSNYSASLEGSALDYYGAWNYLESRGLTVLPWGHSLGFRYVVQAAAWKQEENPQAKIHIISDRSFDDIANKAKEFMSGYSGVGVGALYRYAGWGGSAQEEWNSLKGRKLVLVAPEDPSVPYESASFYKRIQANPEHTDATVIKLRGQENAHTRIYSEEEAQAIIGEVNLMLGRTKELVQSELAKPLKTKPKESDNTLLVASVALIGAIVLRQGYRYLRG